MTIAELRALEEFAAAHKPGKRYDWRGHAMLAAWDFDDDGMRKTAAKIIRASRLRNKRKALEVLQLAEAAAAGAVEFCDQSLYRPCFMDRAIPSLRKACKLLQR
jgi:hypothetical protein